MLVDVEGGWCKAVGVVACVGRMRGGRSALGLASDVVGGIEIWVEMRWRWRAGMGVAGWLSDAWGDGAWVIGCGGAGRDDIGVAVQHGDESVRAGGIDGRAHGACGDSDADWESAVLGFDGQDDTGEW